jgi:hypothetical protein
LEADPSESRVDNVWSEKRFERRALKVFPWVTRQRESKTSVVGPSGKIRKTSFLLVYSSAIQICIQALLKKASRPTTV